MFYFSLTAKPCFPELFIHCFKTERNSHSHTLTLKEYIRTLKRKEIKRRQREKKRDAEEKEADLKRCVWIGAGEVDALCDTCKRYLRRTQS